MEKISNETKINSTSNYNWKLILSYSSLSFLIMLGTNHIIFTIVALLFACVLVVKVEGKENLTGLLFFLLPFAVVFSMAGFALFNMIYFSVVLKFIYHKNGHLPKGNIALILLFIIFNLTFSWGGELFRLMKLCAYFLLAAMLFLDHKPLNLKKMLILYSLGIILAALFTQMGNIFPNVSNMTSSATIRTLSGERVDRFSGLYTNPNFFTMDIIMALSCWFCYFIKRNIEKVEYLFIIILSIIGFSSISNSFLLAYGLLLGIAVIDILKTNFKKGILSLIAMAAFFVIIGYSLDDQTFNALTERVYTMGNAQDAAEFTTRRSDLWQLYFDYIFTSVRTVFFGAGLTVELDYYAHNYFLETLYHLGIIGVILYLTTLSSSIKAYPKLKKKGLINYIPLLIFLFRGVGINLFFRDNKIFFIILAVIALNTDFGKTESTEG